MNGMKLIGNGCIMTLLVFFYAASFGQSSETADYVLESHLLPPTKIRYHSFFVNNSDMAYIPMNGGIFVPSDSAWHMLPEPDRYVTSLTQNIQDSSEFYIVNRADSSVLYHASMRESKVRKKLKLAGMKKGLYSIVSIMNTCIVWGYDGEHSGIAIVMPQGLKWVYRMKGLIRQVQADATAEIYFCLDKSVYRLSDRKIIARLDEPIYGFDFDPRGKLVVSTSAGIGKENGKSIELIATGIGGLVECGMDGSIHVLSSVSNRIYTLKTGQYKKN
jgi:hypothetical protein